MDDQSAPVLLGSRPDAKEPRDALRRLNEELASRNAVLERWQRDQRELTASALHDMRNPLAALWSSLEFARKRVEPSSELFEALADATYASEQLEAIIHDLLFISRWEEAPPAAVREVFALSDLLRGVYEKYRAAAAARRVEWLRPPAADTRLWSDQAVLRRIIENVLDFSLRHTPTGGRVFLAARTDGAVEIAISSSGRLAPGAGDARHSHGGLGLRYSKLAIEVLGGDILLTESPEWPTIFVVRLQSAAVR